MFRYRGCSSVTDCFVLCYVIAQQHTHSDHTIYRYYHKLRPLPLPPLTVIVCWCQDIGHVRGPSPWGMWAVWAERTPLVPSLEVYSIIRQHHVAHMPTCMPSVYVYHVVHMLSQTQVVEAEPIHTGWAPSHISRELGATLSCVFNSAIIPTSQGHTRHSNCTEWSNGTAWFSSSVFTPSTLPLHHPSPSLPPSRT